MGVLLGAGEALTSSVPGERRSFCRQNLELREPETKTEEVAELGGAPCPLVLGTLPLGRWPLVFTVTFRSCVPLRTRHCAKRFTNIIALNPCNHPVR